jgi:hypothetical protein
MTNIIQQPELQQKTLQLYGEFLCRRESWSGQLALAAFAGAGSTGFAAAASLAGAASLIVDSDVVSMKTHFRDGAFDFVVNTLDEALRTIKNEIRLGRPIAIGLTAEPERVLAEAAERGLAATFILSDSSGFQNKNIASVSEPSATQIELAAPSPELTQWLLQREWSLAEISTEAFIADDVVRRKWLRDLPTLQRSVRRGNRWLWLSTEERRTSGFSSE